MLEDSVVRLDAVDYYHLKLIKDWRCSREAYRHFFEFKLNSRREQDAWYENYLKNDKEELFGIVSVKKNTPIGIIGFQDIDARNRRAEFGRFFIEKEYRDCAYGWHALDLLLRYGEQHLNLRRIYCSVLANNVKAIALYETHHFEKEGQLKKHLYKTGEYLDVIIMGRNYT